MARAEEEALEWLDAESYVLPFALRTLGVVRSDPSLVEEAAARLEEMGLTWRAAETRALL